MKVAVIGSRSFQDKKLLEMELSKIDITELISGGAKGADNLAENYAEANNIPVKIFLPDYDRFGRGAPLKRNHHIVDAADQLIAFWDEKSKGTKYTIDLARKKTYQSS
jgi:hypothetical protein